MPVPQRLALTRVEPSELHHAMEGSDGAHGSHGAPDGPGHGQQEIVEAAPRSRGFFREKKADQSTAAPRPESTLPELEKSGRPAQPE